MNMLQKPRTFSGICTVAGSAALLLRLGLLRYGTDQKQLLDPLHIGNLLPLLITGLLLVLAGIAAWKQPKCSRCTAVASPYACGGCFVACTGVAATAIELLVSGGSVLATIAGIFGCITACILAFAAICRLKGQKLHFLLSGLVIIFLMLLPVQLYQSWSAESQFSRYFFQLLGSVCLLLWFYHRAALDADAGSWRVFNLTRWGAVFFCLAAVPGSAYPFFYLTAGVWVLLDSDPVRPWEQKDESNHEAA